MNASLARFQLQSDSILHPGHEAIILQLPVKTLTAKKLPMGSILCLDEQGLILEGYQAASIMAISMEDIDLAANANGAVNLLLHGMAKRSTIARINEAIPYYLLMKSGIFLA